MVYINSLINQYIVLYYENGKNIALTDETYPRIFFMLAINRESLRRLT
jgi:hypothetical protein